MIHLKKTTLTLLGGALLATGCGGKGTGTPTFTYAPISGVPQAVNDLGRLIDQKQRDIVTPGGDQWHPGFSAVDQQNFDASNKLSLIVQQVKASPTFAAGVSAIKSLSVGQQQAVYAAYETPLYPTWAMNGVISGTGTTDAGYAVETEIASNITQAVQAAVG